MSEQQEQEEVTEAGPVHAMSLPNSSSSKLDNRPEIDNDAAVSAYARLQVVLAQGQRCCTTKRSGRPTI
jgi:hypothetical protein